jgi:hypothetical protein
VLFKSVDVRMETSVGLSRFGQSSGIWKVKRVSRLEEMMESEPPWAFRGLRGNMEANTALFDPRA